MSNTDWLDEIKAAALAAFEAASQPPTQPDPRSAPPVLVSEIALAQAALVRKGLSREAAAYQVLNSPLSSFEADIAQERIYAQQIADREAAAKFDASPEGRAALADKLAAEAATEAAMDAQARILLKAEGWEDDELDMIDQQARLRAAGLVQEPTVEDTLANNLDGLTDEEKAWINNGGLEEGGLTTANTPIKEKATPGATSLKHPDHRNMPIEESSETRMD